MIAQIKQQVTIQQLLFLGIIAGISCVVLGLLLLGNSYKERLLPRTYINSIDVSGLSLAESITVLETQEEELDDHELTVSIDDISLASSSGQLEYSIDFAEAANQTYIEQHNTHLVGIALRALAAQFRKTEVIAPKKYNQEKLSEFLEEFNKKVELIGENPSVELKVSGSPKSIVVFPGKAGRTVNTQQTTQMIVEALQAEQHTITAQIASTSAVLTENEREHTVARASHFVDTKLLVIAEDTKFLLTDKELVSFIDPLGNYKKNSLLEFISSLAEKVDRPTQDAVFSYDPNTLAVSEFTPHKDGLQVDQNSSAEILAAWLEDLETQVASEPAPEKKEEIQTPATVHLSLKRTAPEVTLDKTNDLGIQERIGFGESYYYHSIPNRVHNVDITAKKISLTIVPPGKEFSFNKALGEVSARTGYRSAYIISGGKTVLGDGGGVCQVSSTLFRSVLDAGLDVSKRLQHSYRVSYYELNSEPGFDATVYSGEVDFRFINDTPGHIILVAHNDPQELYMNIEIYGTNDGRVSEIHDYKQWGFVGAPAPEYHPTTDLPKGVTRQIDWAVSGIKTEFTHTVRRKDGGILHKDTYYSNYRPWSAKYMVGI